MEYVQVLSGLNQTFTPTQFYKSRRICKEVNTALWIQAFYEITLIQTQIFATKTTTLKIKIFGSRWSLWRIHSLLVATPLPDTPHRQQGYRTVPSSFYANVVLPGGVWAVAAAVHLLNPEAAPSSSSFSDSQVTKGLKITSWHQCCGSGSGWIRIKLKGRIWIRIKVRSWIRIRINLQTTSQWAYLSTFSRFWAFIWKLDTDPHQSER